MRVFKVFDQTYMNVYTKLVSSLVASAGFNKMDVRWKPGIQLVYACAPLLYFKELD